METRTLALLLRDRENKLANDEVSEWRIFSDRNKDPDRVGESSSILFDGMNHLTFISEAKVLWKSIVEDATHYKLMLN